MKKIQLLKTLIIVFVINIIFTSDIQAKIVINEIFANPSGPSSESDEFIEIYNTSETESYSLVGYILEETKSYMIDDGTIAPGEYISLTRKETGLALNNSGDTITLKNNANEIIDIVTFDSSIEDRSWSRIPNGIGEFVNNTQPTKNAENNAPPQPSINPTPEPTAIPSPTATQIPTPVPTRKPTVTRSHPTNIPSIMASNSVERSHTHSESHEETQMQSKSNKIGPILLILGGSLLLLTVIVYAKYYKQMN